MSETKSHLPRLPCACASLRRAARAVTQYYEEAMRLTGLRSSQFTLLQTLSLTGEITQGNLGRVLAMDSTTLTRTLAIMARSGWIARRRGEDRREWRFRLTPAGAAELKRAYPLWERAQAEMQKKLGKTRWEALQQIADEVSSALTD
ncbi:MAG TPA: MarR family transcriptional regulator [Terriglobales bacterium]|nr:MarR family transcriptional regulator [Terriglobales bacterium]